MILNRYETWSEFIALATSDKMTKDSRYFKDENRSWYGDLTYDAAVNYMRTGDESLVPQAEKLLAQIEEFADGIEIRDWLSSPFGAYPVVPEYLAGKPDCMRMIAPTGDVSPINLYVGLTPEWNVQPEELIARGTAILALVLKLQSIRPVELKIVSDVGGNEDCIEVVTIDSKPVSIAHAAYALTSIGFVRRVFFNSANVQVGFTGSFSSIFRKHGERSFQGPKYIAEMRKVLGLETQDVFVPGVRKGDLSITNPVQWINEQIKNYAKE